MAAAIEGLAESKCVCVVTTEGNDGEDAWKESLTRDICVVDSAVNNQTNRQQITYILSRV